VEEVRAVQFPILVEVTGQVAAVTQATLSSKIQGTVLEVRVREGTLVSKGEILLTLDSRDLRANLARADAELENAKAHLARMKRLYDQESVAKQELDNATRSFKVADATKQAAEAQLSYTVIRAPFDGIVTEKKIEVGELAAPGQPMLKLEDPKRARLEATVAEGDLRSVTVGGKVPIVIDALGEQPLTGTVAQVLPSGDPATHTFLVKVDLPPTPGLRTGMFGRMQLGKGSSRTLAISKPGIIERGELTGAFVVGADDIMRLRWVKVGRTVGTSVEILSGLNPGERVLADATQGQDGARVEITEVVAAPVPQKP
jgi:RND family efflux transporter MFP subunit